MNGNERNSRRLSFSHVTESREIPIAHATRTTSTSFVRLSNHVYESRRTFAPLDGQLVVIPVDLCRSPYFKAERRARLDAT